MLGVTKVCGCGTYHDSTSEGVDGKIPGCSKINHLHDQRTNEIYLKVQKLTIMLYDYVVLSIDVLLLNTAD